MLRVIGSPEAPSRGAPAARFSLGGTDYLVMAWDGGQQSIEGVLGTFVADGRRYAVLEKVKSVSAPDLIDVLTMRELEIACLVASGCECKEIARRLRISHHTVRVHLGRIYAKLGMHKQTELAAHIAARLGVGGGAAHRRVNGK